MRNVVSASAMVAVLASCGGGGGGTPGGKPLPDFSEVPATAFAEYSALHEELRAEAEASFHTAFSGGEFPTSGEARFGGTWQNDLAGPGVSLVLYGLADVTADFDAGTAAGRVTNVVGRPDGGDAAAFNGEVAITNGEIGKISAVRAQNDIFFDYAGTLVGGGRTVVLSGSNDMGKFLKTPIAGFEATGTSTATVDGTPVTDEMSLYTVVVR